MAAVISGVYVVYKLLYKYILFLRPPSWIVHSRLSFAAGNVLVESDLEVNGAHMRERLKAPRVSQGVPHLLLRPWPSVYPEGVKIALKH